MTDTSSDSGSEEEINDLLKEAANCDYVNKLYSSKYCEEKGNDLHKDTKSVISEAETITSHQVFLAKKLAKRLDKLIKITDRVYEVVQFSNCEKSVASGIKLLSDSVCIDEVEEVELKSSVSRPPVNTLTEDEYKSRAAEAAVSPDWILSQSNTAFWKFYKPKIVNMNAVKNSDGRLECIVADTTF